MTTFERCKKLIENNSKVITQSKLDVFLMSESITEEEYNTLISMIQNKEN